MAIFSAGLQIKGTPPTLVCTPGCGVGWFGAALTRVPFKSIPAWLLPGWACSMQGVMQQGAIPATVSKGQIGDWWPLLMPWGAGFCFLCITHQSPLVPAHQALTLPDHSPAAPPGPDACCLGFLHIHLPRLFMSGSTFPPQQSLHFYLFLEPPHLYSSPPPHSLTTPQVRQVSCWLQGEGFERLGYNALCGEKG